MRFIIKMKQISYKTKQDIVLFNRVIKGRGYLNDHNGGVR